MNITKAKLWATYYVAMLMAVVAAMVGYKFSESVAISGKTSLYIYYFLIIYVIATLPGSFALMKKVKADAELIEDENVQSEKINTFGLVRLVVIGLGLTACILFFYFCHERSLIWLAGIEAIGLVLCKPKK
ncbi:MAG: hypothetical protein MJZ95_02025 [Paludibacteraceae bacterium]|nr:hypothetical protein [Paludibacteraceae bacterium]